MSRLAYIENSMQESISNVSHAFKDFGNEIARWKRILEKQEEEKRISRRVQNIGEKTSKSLDASLTNSTTNKSISLAMPPLNSNKITKNATSTGSTSSILPLSTSANLDTTTTIIKTFLHKTIVEVGPLRLQIRKLR